ncbi:MAG TPA: F0F1 ATP synthase subunit A [Verrucomicrobiae bacterium]|nr:F0F1 ATP synthase subunit A [Verrucomicrobiae bacterium]
MSVLISIAAEPVFHLGHLTVTNSMLTAAGVSLFLVIVALLVRLSLRKIPKTGQSIFELIYGFLVDSAESVTGNRNVARDLFPFVVTAFIFIVASNWFGLIPGVGSIGVHALHHGEEVLVPIVRAPTSDLNTVLALALCSVLYVQYLAIKYRGVKSYVGTFINFSSPINFFVGILELLSEILRVISYSFRLFGNVFAGEVLIAILLFLTATLAPILPILPLPFYALELFVGAVQGIVFCFLTIVFAGIATADHGGHGDSHAEPAVSK